MIFTSKHATIYAFNTVVTTDVKISINLTLPIYANKQIFCHICDIIMEYLQSRYIYTIILNTFLLEKSHFHHKITNISPHFLIRTGGIARLDHLFQTRPGEAGNYPGQCRQALLAQLEIFFRVLAHEMVDEQFVGVHHFGTLPALFVLGLGILRGVGQRGVQRTAAHVDVVGHFEGILLGNVYFLK